MDRTQFKALTRRNDALALLHLTIRCLFHILLIGGANQLFEGRRDLLGALLLVPHFCMWSFLGWAGLGHELFHRTVFSNPGANTVMFRLCSILTWSNFGFFEISHPIHHRHTLGPEDVEVDPRGRMTGAQLMGALTFDAPGFVRRLRLLGLNAVGTIPGGAAIQTLVPAGSAERRRVRDGARWVLGSQVLMAAAFVAAGHPGWIVEICLAPFFCTFVNRTLAALQHHGLAPDAAAGDYRASTRTVRLDPVLTFFYAAMNFHLEHHHYPSVPYYNLPKLQRLMGDASDRDSGGGYLRALKVLVRNGYFDLPG